MGWGRGGGRGRGKRQGKEGVSGNTRKGERGAGLTGESRIDPTRLMLIRRMNRFPICFIISLLGNYTQPSHGKNEERKTLSVRSSRK